MASITVTDLTFAYEGTYDNIFTHTSFRIDTDWKLGFIGRNGRGKTTFPQPQFAQLPADQAVDFVAALLGIAQL